MKTEREMPVTFSFVCETLSTPHCGEIGIRKASVSKPVPGSKQNNNKNKQAKLTCKQQAS